MGGGGRGVNCPSEFQYWFLYFSAHDGLIVSVIHHVANWWPSILETNRPPQTIHICLRTLTFQQRFVLMPATVNYSAALPQTRVWLAPLKGLKFKLQYLSQLQPVTETPRVKDSIVEFPPLLVFLVLAPLLQWEKKTQMCTLWLHKGPALHTCGVFPDNFTRVRLLHWRPGWKWNEDLKTIDTPDL